MKKKDLQKTLKLLLDLREEDKQGQKHITDKMVNASYYGDYNEYIEDEYQNIAGEIALWRAVILQMIIDLKSNSKKIKLVRAKRRAYKWFTNVNQEDVVNICSLANYNYNKVKKMAQNIIKEMDIYKISKKNHKIPKDEQILNKISSD